MISRFAPAPTGFLHLGHVVNAIYVWGITRARRGRVLLRIEDHDRQRSRKKFESAILEDLAWLGFIHDGPVVRQSDRHELYRHALESLRAQRLVYACDCSRSDVGAPRYPGTCRDRSLAESPRAGLRIRLEPSIERFVDERLGPQLQQPSEQCGDLLVRDRQGNWTYQFAVTVDDMLQEVTMVIRGDDLLDSTGRQLQLARLLGRRDAPAFLHHGLIMKSATQKLSKSDHDTGVHDLRSRGWKPETVIGHAAALAGLIPARRDVHAPEVSTIMSIQRGFHD
jgi:glutamyl-Q tRNA(Asp) synthetase